MGSAVMRLELLEIKVVRHFEKTTLETMHKREWQRSLFTSSLWETKLYQVHEGIQNYNCRQVTQVGVST